MIGPGDIVASVLVTVAAGSAIWHAVSNDDASAEAGPGAPTNEEIVDAVGKSGASVSPHKTNTGEGVTIKFPGGEIIDIRVENHPLTKGGPKVPHANVEAWKADGTKVQNKHIF